MFNNFHRSGGLAVTVAALLTSCASREVPPRYPRSAAASLQAPAPPPARLARAFQPDAEPAPTAPSSQAGHHDHHH